MLYFDVYKNTLIRNEVKSYFLNNKCERNKLRKEKQQIHYKLVNASINLTKIINFSRRQKEIRYIFSLNRSGVFTKSVYVLIYVATKKLF